MHKKKLLLCVLIILTCLHVGAQTPAQELYMILSDEQWYIWYFNDILRSKNRDTMYIYDEELKNKPRTWAEEDGKWVYWYDYLRWQTYVLLSDNSKVLTITSGHHYDILNINKKKSLFILEGFVTDSILKQNKSFDNNIGINWDLINNRTEFTFLFLFDGDYLDIFIDDFDTYFTTFCHFYGHTWEQLESLIYTNTCDLTNVTFPRRADKNHRVGTSCIVAENLRLRKEESTSSETLQTMQTGTSVKILQLGKKQTIDGITANWVQVELADGTRGWCFGGYLVEK